MKSLTQQELKEIFKDSDFQLRFDTVKRYGNNYCYIDRGDENLCVLRGKISDSPTRFIGLLYRCWCVLRGKISDSPTFDKIAYLGYNKKTGHGNDDTRNDCRIAFMELAPEKRQKIFAALELTIPSQIEQVLFAQKQKRNKYLEDKLSSKPTYSQFYPDNDVFMVMQREELILENTGRGQFIGTFGLASCIGVAIIAKKEGKVQRVGLAHVDALTELESIGILAYHATQGADHVDLVMISSENEIGRAREILNEILFNPELEKKTSVVAELSGSDSFAVNVHTGSVYKNIPKDCFVMSYDEEPASLQRLRLSMPSELSHSPFYETETRTKSLQSKHQNFPIIEGCKTCGF